MLSFIWPGFGQLYQRDRRKAVLFALPPALLLAVLAFLVIRSPQGFALRLFVPTFALGILVAIGIDALWRVAAILDSWRSSRTRPVRKDVTAPIAFGLSVAVLLVHGVAAFYVQSVTAAGVQIFQNPGRAEQSPLGSLDEWTGNVPGATATPGPSLPVIGGTPGAGPSPLPQGPINVLFVGVDSGFGRDHALTDSIMLTSFNPSSGRLIQISVPRDTGRMPLYTGTIYEARINTFAAYVQRNPERFPGESPIAALSHEVGYVLGVDIPYYAMVNLEGFIELIDLVGGVDVVVEQPINDPFWKLEMQPGRHHLNAEQALVFVRSRFGQGNSDYERARRQQQVLLAVAKKVRDPLVMTRLPEIASKVSRLIRTNVPLTDLEALIDMTERVTDAQPEKYVLSPPHYSQRIPPSETGGRWMTEFKLNNVAELSIQLFGDRSRYSTEGLPPAASP